MQNAIVCNTNDSNDNVVNSNVTDKSDKGTLTPLSLKDVRCDQLPVKERLLDIVNEYRHSTWLPDEPLGKYQGDQLRIGLKEDVVINKPAYRILFAAINTMLNVGVITHSKSIFNSPLIIVKRENHDLRPCLDYRALDEVIKPISYPLPRISDVLNSMSQNLFMSTLNMAPAFYQLLIHYDDRHKMVITVRNPKFEFTSVRFGLQSSLLFFARVSLIFSVFKY